MRAINFNGLYLHFSALCKCRLISLHKPFKEHFPDWSYAFDCDSHSSHFYHHKTANGYPQSEIILLEDKSVEIFYEGEKRNIDLSWYNLPSKIDTFPELKHLLDNFKLLKPCPAIDFVKFGDVCTSSDNDIVFNTSKGQPAAFIETVPSNFHRRIIRSAKCSIYLQDFESKGGFPCDSCRKVAQYLRTVRSTRTDEKNLKSTETKFARLDQLKPYITVARACKSEAPAYLRPACKYEVSWE